MFTLCIAIASLGFLAVPSLLNAAMNRQVQERHLYDAGVSTRVLDLTPAQLSAVGHLPGIAAVKARLDAAGYPVTTQEIYVTEAQITAADTTILTIVQILGLLVVAIMLMGLVSALSMGVIERTREVGILRCVGARARHIRWVFSAEAVAWPPSAGRSESCSAG